MEHVLTAVVTLTSCARQFIEQRVSKSRIDARLSPFIADVQKIVDLCSLQDSSNFDSSLLEPPLLELQKKIAAELPYDPATMTYPAYVIKSSLSSAVGYVQYTFGSLFIPDQMLTKLNFSVNSALAQVKQKQESAGRKVEDTEMVKHIKNTLDEYRSIVNPKEGAQSQPKAYEPNTTTHHFAKAAVGAIKEVRSAVKDFSSWCARVDSSQKCTKATKFFEQLKPYLEKVDDYVSQVEESKLSAEEKDKMEAVLLKLDSKLKGIQAAFKVEKPSWTVIEKSVNSFGKFLLGKKSSWIYTLYPEGAFKFIKEMHLKSTRAEHKEVDLNPLEKALEEFMAPDTVAN